MDGNNENVKITYAKKINKINFNSVISVPIDSNVNIKTILDINSYLFDAKVECGNGKAILTGKIGLKILYIDTDNITNSISNSQSFSESIADSSITADCFININESNIVNNILSTDNILKINCDITISPTLYINLGLTNKMLGFENLIVKKSEVKTNSILEKVNTNFDYTTTIETKDTINKILTYNAYFTQTQTVANTNCAVLEGKLYSVLIYETNKNEEIVIKEIVDSFNLKTDVEIVGIDNECLLDLTYTLDNSACNIVTETDDDNNIISINHKINVSGVCLKPVTLDVVDDLYSTSNEIETSVTKREYVKNIQHLCFDEKVYNELSLSSEETAIDEVISNLHITPEITNYYIKDNKLTLEGLISSHLVYVDENKECKNKTLELPFVVDTDIMFENIDCLHSAVSVVNNNVKVKRGTILEIEYALCYNVCLYEKESHEIVDNIVLGKALDNSAYDFQIYLTKPNETMWDVCKRIKISVEELEKYNKNLPLVMEGGEKIVVKRF